MLAFYLLPVAAVVFDLRFANVSYPAFLAHVMPPLALLLLHAAALRRDGLYRPRRAPVLSWEKVLFLLLQWPWVFWGCVMAVRDRLTGRFVDFRITPKGATAPALSPPLILAIYGGLALVQIVPVLLAGRMEQAGGFLLLALIAGGLYAATVAVIVVRELRDHAPLAALLRRVEALRITLPLAVFGALLAGLTARGLEGLHVLTIGLDPLRVVRVEAPVSGAGRDASDGLIYRFAFEWRANW